MSQSISVDDLSRAELEKILHRLEIADKQMYRIENNRIFIPSYFAANELGRRIAPQCNRTIDFVGTLRGEQTPVYEKIIKFLYECGACVLSARVGFGKTVIAAHVISHLSARTLILTHRQELMKQWKQVIESNTTARVQLLKSNQEVDIHSDVLIINPLIIKKIYKKLPSFGLLIADEVHLLLSRKQQEAFQYIEAAYCLALSATPYRIDEYDALIKHYFGTSNVSFKLFVPHDVYKIETNIRFEEKKRGRQLDWTDILKQQMLNESRNRIILDILLQNLDRKFMILCKRIQHVESLESIIDGNDILSKKKIEIICGSEKVERCGADIVIATTSKGGVGFDYPGLDALIIAADMKEYFVQYLGRVVGRSARRPIVFDLVDKNYLLHKHWEIRRDIYSEHGGEIQSINVSNWVSNVPSRRG